MGPGCQNLKLLGTISAALSWKGRRFNKRLYVVAGWDLHILGYHTIVALGVAMFDDNVTPARTTLLAQASPQKVTTALFAGLGSFPGLITQSYITAAA